MGLLYAFYVAGNQNTVMTLWKVINKSTAGFTKSFFESFVPGKNLRGLANLEGFA
ncbi:MAG: hypothetical protein DRR19_17040 [Candidatus Parabeggiatoa sp. nov. 1]|nr:MAG: hypothetical protein DRR19_17040 [Gammaproteobacteria bacterium]